MKFSIAIPTRNRLEYLKTAIASILAQDYENWEIVISDNDSEQDIKSYVESLKEDRIIYSKSHRFLSVTENWNRALDQCSGEYVFLIGDDDCLLKNALSTLYSLIQEHNLPDLVFSNGILYCYPGFSSVYPEGDLITIGNWHLWGNSPKIIDHETKLKIAKDSLNLKLRFSYNLQVVPIHKSLIKSLRFKEQFFHSPFPDFYAITALLIESKKMLFCPYPLTVIGICPKSFGGHAITNQEAKGIRTLNAVHESSQYKKIQKYILPGKEFNTFWLYALHSVKENLPQTLNLKVGFGRYRRGQLIELISDYINLRGNHTLLSIFKNLKIHEMLVYGPILGFLLFVKCFLGNVKAIQSIEKIRQRHNTHPGHINYRFKKKYHSIHEIIDEITPKTCSSLLEINKV